MGDIDAFVAVGATVVAIVLTTAGACVTTVCWTVGAAVTVSGMVTRGCPYVAGIVGLPTWM